MGNTAYTFTQGKILGKGAHGLVDLVRIEREDGVSIELAVKRAFDQEMMTSSMNLRWLEIHMIGRMARVMF